MEQILVKAEVAPLNETNRLLMHQANVVEETIENFSLASRFNFVAEEMAVEVPVDLVHAVQLVANWKER